LPLEAAPTQSFSVLITYEARNAPAYTAQLGNAWPSDWSFNNIFPTRFMWQYVAPSSQSY